jgi:hypothetical protein
MELSKPLLANSDLTVVPALEDLMLYLVRFHFAESLPVPINGSNLEAQVMANPFSVCHASRLCLPLPYLRCQLIFSASFMVSPLCVLCLCLPSPPWAYWDPASHEEPVAWYLMT